jgi:tight adherence protein C
MILLLICGAGVGVGLWALLRGAFPPPAPLAQALPSRPPAAEPDPVLGTTATAGWAARAGRPAAPVLAGFGLPAGSVRRDLAVCGRTVQQHLAEKATAATVGLLAGPALLVLPRLAGWPVPMLWPAGVALGLAVVGFIIPDVGVRVEAARRRADFRHALSALLDLVVIALAGGAGVDQALHDAASIAQGWSATLIRRALRAAYLARTPAWTGLAQLGTEFGIGELGELAAAVSLAGSEGAKVRASLAAKAAALRAHQLAEAETAAQAASERMSLPVVVLFAGFLLFIAYPAVMTVLTGW